MKHEKKLVKLKLTQLQAYKIACLLNGERMAILEEATIKRKGEATKLLNKCEALQVEIDQLLGICSARYLSAYTQVQDQIDMSKVLENKDKLLKIFSGYKKPEITGGAKMWHDFAIALGVEGSIIRIKKNMRK